MARSARNNRKDPHDGPSSPNLYSMSADGCLNISQVYAIEGGTYVLHCTSVCNQKGIDTLNTSGGLLFQKPGGGHSVVVGPDGRILSEPLGNSDPTVEGIVYADLDLTHVVANSGFIDVVGHYSRPDLLWLGVDKQDKKCVVVRDAVQKP
ncbi:hypothetical protein P280DRAFT_438317 [Massarina eburnea CBS 473.64]|uniref:nitrilase n=1 Tax=Massarina eburnea CBS 473.64 TaxID=1395130 RepID=A0A6A6RI78_9PLEO|nr:hypothetical protein P280DRAFT_438317 [Massarina eburnea CBS 473.64]